MPVFAKDGIEIRNLLRARPTLVEPAEPVYELEIQGETDAQRINREVLNQEKQAGWDNHIIKARERGVLCNSYRWDEADARVRSYLFLCLGAEGQRQVQQKRPNLFLHNVTKQEFMTILKDIFVTNRIVAFERNNFICRKQKKSESLEQFHTDHVELAYRADCGDREDEWVRDMFTAHMHNEKTAEELLAQTRTPQDAYEYAIRREKGIEHIRTGRIEHGRPYPRGSQNTRGQQRKNNTNSSKQCYKGGNQYNQNHLQSYLAKDKICSKCAKRGHFAKVCRSTNVNYLGTREDEQQEELETESLETENNSVAFAELTSNNGWDEYQIDKFSVTAIAESFEIKNTNLLSEDDLNGHIVKLKTNSEELFAMADSGNPMSFLNEKTARRIQQNHRSALF